MGRNGIATAPATTMTMASTEAKMGRSMKKLTNTASAPGRWRKRLHRGLYPHPGPDLLETLDHHVLAGLHAVLDDPQRPYTCAHPNGAHLHGPVRCDHEQRRGALAFLDRGLRHDERVGELREEGAKPHVLARLKQPRRIRKDGTQGEGARARVHGAVNEIDPSVMRVGAVVGQRDGDAGGRWPAGFPHGERLALAHAEADVHRIDRGHRGEQRGLALSDE